MGRVLGQPLGLAGGRVGPGGWVIWDWVNRYWVDPTKNVFFEENVHFRTFIGRFRPSRPRQWIRLEVLHRMASTRGLET